MYKAVIELLGEGADAAGISVSSITDRAGIGKGTAYEYFATKDEIIACAIVYQMRCIFECLESELGRRNTFRDQLDYMLDQAEKQEVGMHCFLRFVHLMTDSSEFYSLVREKIGSEEFKPYLPVTILGRILRQGASRGEVRDDVPIEYLIYCIFSHLLTYMIAWSESGFTAGALGMRPLVRRGILNEVEGRAAPDKDPARQ